MVVFDKNSVDGISKLLSIIWKVSEIGENYEVSQVVFVSS